MVADLNIESGSKGKEAYRQANQIAKNIQAHKKCQKVIRKKYK